MPRSKLISHVHGDPDSVLSLCAATRLVPGMEDAEIVLVGGRDHIHLRPGDLAVDIPADGQGIKGYIEGKKVHSALASVVELYASAEDKKALKYLVDYIDSHDSCGSVVGDKIPNVSGTARWMLSRCNVVNAIFAIKLAHTTVDEKGKEIIDEETVFQRVLEIFDGVHEAGRKGISLAHGIDSEYAEYLLRGYRRNTTAVAIQAILRFFSIKRDLAKAKSNRSVVDELLGTEYDSEIRALFAENSIDAVLGALWMTHRNSWRIFESRVSEMLDGFLKMDEADARAEVAAAKAELFAEGKVALTRGGPVGTDNALRKRGVVAIVYKDGINMGVVVKGLKSKPFVLRDGTILKANHPAILDVIERAGDPPGTWWVHPAEYFAANGTRKAPTDRISKVNEYDLVHRIEELVTWKI